MKKLTLLTALLCASMMGWAQPRLVSEYCQEPMGAIDNGRIAGFTWETTASGDVVITLSEADGGAAGTTNFRNTNKTGNGMCDDGLGKFKVGGENATNYFEREFTLGSQEYTLKLKDGVAAPAIGTTITFSGFVEYETSDNKDCWPNLSFSYTYGSKCASLDKPTNIAISAGKVITFDAVTNATSYKVFVYWKGEIIHEQVVVNGGTINYHPSLTGTYKVYVQAYGTSDAFSPLSDEYDWNLTAELAYLPVSEWCETEYETNGANESENVNVTWTTNAKGDVLMTLSPIAGNTQTYATEFRALMSLDNLKIGEEKADASTYFTTSYSGATQTFTLIDPAVKPEYGTMFYFDGVVPYRTGIHNNCWPTMHFTIVYGSTCFGYNDHVAPSISDFSVDEKEYSSVTFHVSATDVDDLGTTREIASYQISSDDNGFVTKTVDLDVNGNFTIDGLKDNETYTFTLSVIDAIGNVSTEEIEVELPFNSDADLALNKKSTAGFCQGANTADRANNGDAGNYWTCFDNENETTSADWWWKVDLGNCYEINRIQIHFNDCWNTYSIYSSKDDVEWSLVKENEPAASNLTKNYTSLTVSARYLKAVSSVHQFGIKEFNVYGTGLTPAPSPGTAIDNIEAGEKAVKVIENGQIIIIKNGVRYNALGSIIK